MTAAGSGAPDASRYRLGVDIGGTFTDFVLTDGSTGAIAVEKTLTTPQEPERGVLSGIAALGARFPGFLAATRDVIHATTLVTNVILERKGARTGLLTTAGFRDILEIGREVRYTVFDLFIRFPEPLVARSRRFDISERMYADGSVAAPLDEDAVRAAARAMAQDGVEAVAVCYLHAYANPAHERRTAEILAEELQGVPVSLSHQVHPEPKEFERTSTTVVNAYVQRVVDRYVDRLAARLAGEGFDRRLYLMLSNGGTATGDTARRFPIQLLESGPAAGVEAAGFYARMMGVDHALAFDMGGTTAKLCIVENGRAARTRSFEVGRVHRFTKGSGIPVALPVYDLLEIGAGGGSIARIDDLGLLTVGPQSAGSDPGPICYGQGGTRPTVTDADLVLGYLDAGYFLGGTITLDHDAARTGIEADLARPMALPTLEAAAGVHTLVNEIMASAARMHLTEKGKDPGAMTLIASGGAGPVHAAELARKLGCPRVVIPPFSGVMSALGLLAAPIAFERTRIAHAVLDDLDPAELADGFAALTAEAVQLLPSGGAAEIRRTLGMRYSGQDYALEIEVAPWASGDDPRRIWRAAFLDAYARQYGKIDYDSPVEVAALTLRATLPDAPPVIAAPRTGPPGTAKGRRAVFVMRDGALREVPVYERSDLVASQRIDGPAIVEERESTTVVGPGDTLEVDPHGCLVLTLEAAASATAPTRAVEVAE